MPNFLSKLMTPKEDEEVKLFWTRDNNEENIEEVGTEIEFKTITLEEAITTIQKELSEDVESELLEKQELIREAMCGNKDKIQALEKKIAKILQKKQLNVQYFTLEEAAFNIYSKLYGMDILEKYYRQKEVNEIRVNGPGKHNVFLQINGINVPVKEYIEDDETIRNIIKRLMFEDYGAPFDLSNPRVESIRRDGSRLTATCPPIAAGHNFILRKHDAFEPSLDNLIAKQTLNQQVWKVLSILTKGRANILFSGNVGAGKTTLMKKLVGELEENLRILVIGKDSEAMLKSRYPKRDIIEFEEHNEVGVSMKDIFITALRESPDVIIVEEFRGAGEAIEAIKACTRGLPGSMATAHFNSPEEVIEGTGMLMLEEGLTLPLELAKIRVARAFNVVVQMLGDSVKGIKKLSSITEVYVNIEGKIVYNDLLKWIPNDEFDYFGEGVWKLIDKPSNNLLARLKKNVSKVELEKLGWL